MNNWRELAVENSKSLRSAMEIIDKTGLQTALVTNSDGSFVGTLTDGDIRRAILSGATLADAIDQYVNHKPVTISSEDEITIAFEAMERLALRCVPVVKDGRIVGLINHNLTSPIKNFNNPVLIMAGGRGERLKPLTNSIPKPLIKVGGKTLLEILLDRLARCGFSDIWISVHYLSEQIEDLVGNGERFGLKIKYIKESVPLGTVGAYLELPKESRQLPTLIVNADLVSNVDFSKLLLSHQNSSSPVTIGVIKHFTEVPFGVVEIENEIVTSIVEKPTLSNFIYAGVAVYCESSFEGFEYGQPIQATEIYSKLLSENKKISIFKIDGYWRDIGTGESLRIAHRDLGLG